MSLTPLHLVSAHPWQRVVFTTYALSLSFFESTILDGLVRGGSTSLPLILADVHGVRQSLSEQGAHRVGKDYEVEPVAMQGFAFHPKIAVLASSDHCHLMVGSGNLTFNGWGGNCEVIEHLHAGFAREALRDAAAFFDRLSDSSRVKHAIGNRCQDIASVLRRSTAEQPLNDSIRLLHNFDRSLIDQIAEAAGELGGAKRLALVAPFWDSGVALDKLCRELNVNDVLLHSHAHGTVEGTIACNWPHLAETRIQAVRVEDFDGSTEKRRLHAKALEILCKRGRLVVSGSANGTLAALSASGNIEACVMRIQGRTASPWKWVRTKAPEPRPDHPEATENEEASAGVLRAVLEGDQLSGQVLIPKMRGVIAIEHLTPFGPKRLTEAAVETDGRFRAAVPELETRSWSGGRLVLRVTDSFEHQAEGFVSVAHFADIARRGGVLTPRLLAVIFGRETPDDVNAILSWFLEDINRLSPSAAGSRNDDASRMQDESEQLVPVAALTTPLTLGSACSGSGTPGGQRSWERFLEQVLMAFRETRPPFDVDGRGILGDDDEESAINRSKTPQYTAAIDKSYASFEQLFEILTAESAPPRYAEIAFDITGFICARLRPDAARACRWLTTAVRTWLRGEVRPERRENVAAAILALLGISPDEKSARKARTLLLKLGRDLSEPPPANESVKNVLAALPQLESFADLWTRLHNVITYEEQIRAYIKAFRRTTPASNSAYPDLPAVAAEAWPLLAKALVSSSSRSRILIVTGLSEACPQCNICLPVQELDKLETFGIALTKNCCRSVVIKDSG